MKSKEACSIATRSSDTNTPISGIVALGASFSQSHLVDIFFNTLI